MDEEDEVVKLLYKHQGKLNRYAGHWEWPNKSLKEKGIAEDFVRSHFSLTGKFLKVFGPGEDPPDIVLEDEKGQKIALELTELVSQKTIEQWDTGVSRDWARWSDQTLLGEIRNRIEIKDTKLAKRSIGFYARFLLVLHTDEPVLTPKAVERILSHPIETRKLDEAFVLFSYDPCNESYPLIRVPIIRFPNRG